MRKRWIAVSVLTGALALAGLGGTVLAQTGDEDTPAVIVAAGQDDLLARVAEIVGVDEQALKDAFDQAAEERRDGALEAFLDAQVEAGRLTEDEAQEILDWHSSRPEALEELRGFHRPFFDGAPGIGPQFRFRFRHDQLGGPLEDLDSRLDELRERFNGGFRLFGPRFHFELDAPGSGETEEASGDGASA